MTEVTVALIQWGVIAYAVWRFAAVVERFVPAPVEPDVPVPLPQDLLAVALSHNEEWAQEETMRAMRERYALVSDWNAVRAAFGVGRIDP
jgi:hypothetical protein